MVFNTVRHVSQEFVNTLDALTPYHGLGSLRPSLRVAADECLTHSLVRMIEEGALERPGSVFPEGNIVHHLIATENFPTLKAAKEAIWKANSELFFEENDSLETPFDLCFDLLESGPSRDDALRSLAAPIPPNVLKGLVNTLDARTGDHGLASSRPSLQEAADEHLNHSLVRMIERGALWGSTFPEGNIVHHLVATGNASALRAAKEAIWRANSELFFQKNKFKQTPFDLCFNLLDTDPTRIELLRSLAASIPIFDFIERVIIPLFSSTESGSYARILFLKEASPKSFHYSQFPFFAEEASANCGPEATQKLNFLLDYDLGLLADISDIDPDELAQDIRGCIIPGISVFVAANEGPCAYEMMQILVDRGLDIFTSRSLIGWQSFDAATQNEGPYA